MILSACATPAPETGPIDYGQLPSTHEAQIRKYFDTTLKDPASIQYREITVPEKGYFRAPLIAGGRKTYGWMVRATINAKNSYGGYVGFRTYSFVFRDDALIGAIPPAVE